MTNYFIFWMGEGRDAIKANDDFAVNYLRRHALHPTTFNKVHVIPNEAKRSEESSNHSEKS